jgi:hypothetical protein
MTLRVILPLECSRDHSITIRRGVAKADENAAISDSRIKAAKPIELIFFVTIHQPTMTIREY